MCYSPELSQGYFEGVFRVIDVRISMEMVAELLTNSKFLLIFFRYIILIVWPILASIRDCHVISDMGFVVILVLEHPNIIVSFSPPRAMSLISTQIVPLWMVFSRGDVFRDHNGSVI